MDKNTILGTVLIGVLIVGYFFVTKPSEAELERQAIYRDSIENVAKQNEIIERQNAKLEEQGNDTLTKSQVSDSVNSDKEFGRYASAAKGTEVLDYLENDSIRITLSNKGGQPKAVQLKGYKTYYKKPLILLSNDSTKFGIQLSEIGKLTNTLFFTKVESKEVNDSAKTIVYRLYANETSYIEYIYSLKPNSYAVDFTIHTVGMEQFIKESRYNLFWETSINSFEKTKKIESDNTKIVWKYSEDDVESLDSRATEPEKEKLTGKVKWVSFKYQYFTAAIIAKEDFERGGEVNSKRIDQTDTATKVFSTQLYLPKQETNSLTLYFGPNHYPTLKAQNVELEGILDLGWFGFITKFAIIPIFNWLRGFFSSFGLIILLLTIILKVVLFPLTFKSYLSSARMRVLKPQVDELGKKFSGTGEAMKKQQATMELYKKAGVNPMGGCLPLLIQFPILIAMFNFFPASIELRQQGFLWAEDLSSFDAIYSWSQDIPLVSSFYGNHISLFTLLMAVSMMFVNQLNTSNMTTTPGMPNMKVMMWIMSVMMIFWFNSYSSGLSYYYFLANVITLLQTYIIRQMVDDKKILAKIETNRKTPKKKSRFQMRLEDMAKQQQLKAKKK